jgi:predicted TIM-barrel fold metal-dependent hydrolase
MYTLTTKTIDHVGTEFVKTHQYDAVHEALRHLRRTRDIAVRNSGLAVTFDDDTLVVLRNGLFIREMTLEITINRGAA